MSSKPSGGGFVRDVRIFGIVVVVEWKAKRDYNTVFTLDMEKKVAKAGGSSCREEEEAGRSVRRDNINDIYVTSLRRDVWSS